MNREEKCDRKLFCFLKMAFQKYFTINTVLMKCIHLLVALWLFSTFTSAVNVTLRAHRNIYDAYSSDIIDYEMGVSPPKGLRPPRLEKPGGHKRQKRMLYGSHFIDPKTSYLTYPVIRYFVTISHAHQCTFRMAERFFQAFKKIEVKLSVDVLAHCVMPYDNPRCGGSMIAPRVVLTACHCLATFWQFNNETLSTNPREKGVWEDHNLIFRPGNDDEIVVDADDDWRKRHEAEYLKTTSLAFTTFELFMFSKKYYVHDKCKHIRQRVFSYDFGYIFLSKDFMNIPDYVAFTRPSALPTPNFALKHRYIFAPVITEKTAQEAWLAVQRHQTTCLMVGTGWDLWAAGAYQALPPPGMIKYTWRTVASYMFCARFLQVKFQLSPWNLTFWKGEMGCDEGYNDCSTWDCTIQAGRIEGIPAFGDEGGPVVCDKLLYGIISASFPPDAEPFSEVTLIQSNVFNVQSHAELRPSLLLMEAGQPIGTDALPADALEKDDRKFLYDPKWYAGKIKRSAATRSPRFPLSLVSSILSLKLVC